METYKELVLEEYRELKKKSEALTAFVQSDKMDSIKELQKSFLFAQSHVMLAYVSILMSRLSDWGVNLLVEGETDE